MAKVPTAALPKAESLAIGSALARMLALVGWSLKEFAAAVDRNERQCARWIDGTEHAQLDTIFAVAVLRQPLVVALAELAEMDVVTEIRSRRRA